MRFTTSEPESSSESLTVDEIDQCLLSLPDSDREWLLRDWLVPVTPRSLTEAALAFVMTEAGFELLQLRACNSVFVAAYKVHLAITAGAETLGDALTVVAKVAMVNGIL